MPINPKQLRFVSEYLIDLNASQAAVRAGYSPRTSAEQASRMLKNPKVQLAIQEARQKLQIRTDITIDRVLKEIARVAFGDPRDVMTWGPDGIILKSSEDLTEDQAAQVSEVSETTTMNGGSMKVKKHDKVKALELLGRHLGMFKDPGSSPNNPLHIDGKLDLSTMSDEELKHVLSTQSKE